MVRKATKFTPEILLGSPRRSIGNPSPDGEYVLHSVSTYDFREHKQTSEIRILQHEKGLSHLIVGESKATEAHWLPGNRILYLKKEANGETGRTEFIQSTLKGKHVGLLGIADGAIHDLKLKILDNNDVLLLGWGRADQDGKLVNEKKIKPAVHNSRLYDSLMARHWDSWKDKYHNALFFAHLRSTIVSGLDELAWVLTDWTSVHGGSRLECPIAPQPSSDDYEISQTGITFVAKDPYIDPALHTKADCYFVPIHTRHGGNYEIASSSIVDIDTGELKGAASCPVFSPDGKSVAFLKMEKDKSEADQNRVILATGVTESNSVNVSVRAINPTDSSFDISPEKICFGHGSSTLYMLAQFHGITRVWLLETTTGTCEQLTRKGNISDIRCLYNPPRLFLSGSSLVDDSFYGVLWPDDPKAPDLISSHSRNGELYGLQEEQSTSFWYHGSKSTIQALMFTPTGFDWESGKRYPLALLVHGGPQAAWLDAWSTRWNPAAWAEQGYVVIMPNITGSTGYGQDFVDAITENWGGDPYEDLVKLWDHIEEQMPFVDTDRAIAAGASYGGYMMNWIQGHDLGRKFKAIVCHDGVFSNFASQMSTDGIFFGAHDLGGPVWEKKEYQKAWFKWDPVLHIHKWKTPQLVIHNEQDFRLSIAEGMGAFNVLQARGIPSRLLVGKDENHWTVGQENSLVWHTVVFNWINHYAKLPPYKEDERSIIEPDEQFVDE